MESTDDPWAFQRWAYRTKVGSTPRKAVLMMLATLADRNTGRCEARQEFLASGTESGERTVRAALKRLEADGFIARRRQNRVDGSRRNDEILLLAPWVSEWPDGLPAPAAGRDTGTSQQSLPASDDTSSRQERPGKNGPGEQPEERLLPAVRAPAREAMPDDFPAEWIGAHQDVCEILTKVATHRGSICVAPASVAQAMMRRPRKPWLQAAEALEHWAIFGGGVDREVRDVVARWRTWLDREPDVQPSNVHRLSPRDERAARLERRLAPAREEGLI